jgi:hypothetical protein
MDIEHRWQDRPEAINLGVVAVDLRGDYEEHGNSKSKGGGTRERVSRDVYFFEGVDIFRDNCRVQLFGERSDLRQEWSHGMVKGDAVCERLDLREGESHCRGHRDRRRLIAGKVIPHRKEEIRILNDQRQNHSRCKPKETNTTNTNKPERSAKRAGAVVR